MISFGLEEEQQLVQETVRRLAATELRPRMREHERLGGVTAPVRARFAELGLELGEVPAPLGGQGASLMTAALVHEELSWGDPGAAVALTGSQAALAAILFLGDAEQQRRWVAPFASTCAPRRAALAWSERQPAPSGFATRARRVDGGWQLDGEKAFVVNGGEADLVVVLAARDGGAPGDTTIEGFIVERGTPGLVAGARHALGSLEAVAAAPVRFAGCRVPEAQRLRGRADGLTRLWARGMIVNAARQVGLARAAYEHALAYTQERHAFGKPVAHFQAIAFTLADMAMDVDAARWLTWRAACAFDRGDPSHAWGALAHANEAAWRVADHAVQLLGGAGYVKDHPTEKWLRDTKALALFAPPSEAAALALGAEELGHAVEPGWPTPLVQPFFT